MFDFFKNLFDDIFGDKDDDDGDGFGFSEVTGDDISFSPDPGGFDLGSFVDLQDRLLMPDDVGREDEFVNDFYSLDEALAYVEGTPENVLKIVMDESSSEGEEFEVYHVYRVQYE
jgi:hypothetical protein